MNLSQLRTAFLHAADDPYQDKYKNEIVHRLLNVAKDQILKVIDQSDENYLSSFHDWVVNAQNADQEETLPTDFRKVLLVERLVTGERPIPLEPIDFANRDLPTTSRAVDHYYLRGDKIGIIAPKESYTARLWYSIQIPDMESDDDKPTGIPNEHHYLLALHALKLSYATEERNWLGSAWADEYERQMTSLRNTVKARQRQRPRYVNQPYAS